MQPTLPELTRVFARIGLMSFGGPAAQIALMHREIVEKHRWVDEKDYLSALSFCMLLPGPEAMQLATWIGWRSHGTRGGLIAGGLFVLPGALVVLALSAIYAAFGQVPAVAALFAGVQAAVVAVVVEALFRVARRALKTPAHRLIALGAFIGLFAFALPFPVVMLAAGLVGAAQLSAPAPGGHLALPVQTRPRSSLTTVLIWSAVWLGPLAGLLLIEGGVLAEVGLYFSKLALLTFGGAYAVLSWMVQEVVQVQGWLTTGQMMDGLGLAETTPGPLILVTEFVGFMAGWKAGGWSMALAGAAVALWMTFAPCFLWIFAGAPHIARLTSQPRLAGALAAITSAVVGVIANLSLWFALHVIFAAHFPVTAGPVALLLPDPASLRPVPLLLAMAAGYLLMRRHWPLPAVLCLAALAAAGLGTL
ncbi:MAG: chromate efflux transporter [Rhodobacteraceae bacterium]|nr:chromate efflux transporter [Paracoccaceae bacterium]